MNTNQKTYYIGDIAQELGLSQRAIRYYEELGFIKPIRTDGGFRTYSQHEIERLRMVIRFKDLGMSLDDIRATLLSGNEALTGDVVRKLRETLCSRRAEFESRIKKYEEGIDQIDRVIGLLSSCTSCGKPSATGQCEECLKHRGENASPLLDPLFSQQETPRKES